MSTGRNLINEILEMRTRQGEIYSRLFELQGAFEKRDTKNIELLRYFPIAIVACIESFFRSAIKSLIDSGEPYLSNAKDLFTKNQIKSDSYYDVLKALHGQSVSIGEVISQLPALSNLEKIDNCMNAIIGEKFLQSLVQVYDRSDVEIGKKPKVPIIQDAQDTFKNVTKTFDFRHIFCHEMVLNNNINASDLESCFQHSALFLKASKEFVNNILYPNAPLTQKDMNISAFKEFKRETELLISLNNEAINLLSDKQVEKFKSATVAWETFLKNSADIEGLTYEGGSIAPMVRAMAAAELTRDRIKQVEKLIKELNYLSSL